MGSLYHSQPKGKKTPAFERAIAVIWRFHQKCTTFPAKITRTLGTERGGR